MHHHTATIGSSASSNLRLLATNHANCQAQQRKAAFFGFVVRLTGRRFGGFVAGAGTGVLELTQDPTRAWSFFSAAEARQAVDLALGLGAGCFRIAITSIGGQQ